MAAGQAESGGDAYQRWQRVARSGTVPLVLALGGPERALVDDALAWARQHALSPRARDFNWDRLAAGEGLNLDRVVATARTLPVLADTRLVEVRDAEELKAADTAPLRDYLTRPPPRTRLLLIFGATVAKNPLWGVLQKAGCAFAFAHPQPWHMPGWVRQRAQRLGVAVTEAGAQALAEAVGADLLLVDRALERLALESDLVTPDNVARCVAQVPLDNVFALSRAVAEGNVARALACLSRLPRGPDVPLRLLGVWAWQLRQIVAARTVLQQGGDAHAVGKQLRLSGTRLRACVAMAQTGTLAGHCARLCYLRVLDEALKTSQVPAWLQLQRAVLALCAAKTAASRRSAAG